MNTQTPHPKLHFVICMKATSAIIMTEGMEEITTDGNKRKRERGKEMKQKCKQGECRYERFKEVLC